ncbi:hypothetical protein [Timonella sp. A28]|uniref:hypothetical protein n=1 Tax=Timonella sp. A28 TaxID=3442640 RepID=UPI003EBB53BF
MSNWRSIAHVESPLQTLNVVEAHAYGILGHNTQLHVRDPHSTIAPTVQALQHIGVPNGLKIVGKNETTTPARTTKTHTAYTHVLGDPFSGQQQSRLLRHTHVSEIVIVDDGLHTIAVLNALAANKPLVRPGIASSPARKALGMAMTHILRKAAFTQRLTVFTAMPATAAIKHDLDILEAHAVFHTYPWLTAQEPTHLIPEPIVCVGSGFAADGHINPQPYIDWVHSLTHNGPVRYFPHRRTPPHIRQRIGTHELITVAEGHPLVELSLSSLTSEHTVHMLPTTALLTLGPLLRAKNVTMRAHRVPNEWWTTDTPAHLREFLTEPLHLFETHTL